VEKHNINNSKSVAVPQLRGLTAGFPLQQPKFNPKSSHVGSAVDKMALGQVSFKSFGFLCHISFHQTLHTYPSSRAGIISQSVADAPSGLSLTPPHKKIKKKSYSATEPSTLAKKLRHIESVTEPGLHPKKNEKGRQQFKRSWKCLMFSLKARKKVLL
jgi:hypothetical protein